jgi:DNA-binding response OmpR family regulator
MKKALIVDDDPNISELLRLYFDKDGFAVVSCLDGEKAYETFCPKLTRRRHSRSDAARQGRL